MPEVHNYSDVEHLVHWNHAHSAAWFTKDMAQRFAAIPEEELKRYTLSFLYGVYVTTPERCPTPYFDWDDEAEDMVWKYIQLKLQNEEEFQ